MDGPPSVGLEPLELERELERDFRDISWNLGPTGLKNSREFGTKDVTAGDCELRGRIDGGVFV